jgi:butanol dehydrogenase
MSMNNFVYDIPTKVYFGENQLGHLGEELKKYGKRVLLVYGGGSTIDATKFIGAGAYYEGDAWDILTKKAPVTDCLPIVTVLTLAATGSEMDSGGVISNLETMDKIGYMHPLLLPKVSFLDPTNSYSVSAYQTACGAADIMSHIIEVYFNMDQDLLMLDSVKEGLLRTVIKYAPIAMKEPSNYEARANLMWTASWAINGFVNGGKRQAWSCHPLEHEISAFYDITHGLGLAILTPRWMEYTLDETTVSKFYQFGCNVFGIDKSLASMEVAKKSIKMLSDFFFAALGLKRSFAEIGIDDANFAVMARKACGGGVLPDGGEDDFYHVRLICPLAAASRHSHAAETES